MADADRPTERPEPDLFDRCRSEAQAAFTLALLDTGLDLTERERQVADLAINAGIVGSLGVLRDDGDSH